MRQREAGEGGTDKAGEARRVSGVRGQGLCHNGQEALPPGCGEPVNAAMQGDWQFRKTTENT